MLHDSQRIELSLMSIILWLYALSFIGLSFTILDKRISRFYLAAKMSCSSIFLIASFILINQGSSKLPWWTYFFFVGCFLGDLFLGLKEQFQKNFFTIGLNCFLIAHLIFINSLLSTLPQLPWWIPTLSLLAFPILHWISSLYGLVLKRSKFFIYLYSYTLTLLFTTSLYGYGLFLSPFFFILALGSFLFLLSDFLLLLIYFKKRTPSLHILNLFFYFCAVLILVLSLSY